MSLTPFFRSSPFFDDWTIHDPFLSDELFFPMRRQQSLEGTTGGLQSALAPLMSSDLIEKDGGFEFHGKLLL